MRSRRQQLSDRTESRDETAIVEELEGQFAAFRRRSRRFSRVPRELRAAVMAALRQGVSLSRLHRVCGVSARQIELWRLAATTASSESELGRARVFSVVDAAHHRNDGRISTSDALELHLGPWTISVRSVGQRQAEPG